MARNLSVLAKLCRPKRMSSPVSANGAHKKRQASLHLYFPLDAKALRTPFRARVLQSIYDIVRQELGGRMVSAGVQVSVAPDDPGHVRLLLSI